MTCCKPGTPICRGPCRVPHYGVQWYVRVLAWAYARARGRTKEGLLSYYKRAPGCGCIVPLKDAWGRWAGRSRQAQIPMPTAPLPPQGGGA